MPGKPIFLLGGSYTARSKTASDNIRLNLYSEKMPPIVDQPTQFAQYPRAGLTLRGNAPTTIGRGCYRATNGDLYVTFGQTIYYCDANGLLTPAVVMNASDLASVVPRTSPVSMADNGTDIMVVDGSSGGWIISMSTRTGVAVDKSVNLGFFGGDTIVFLLTFFVTNIPGTPTLCFSDSNSTNFDPTQVADTTIAAEPISSITAVKGLLWVLCKYHYELWAPSSVIDIFNSVPFTPVPQATSNWGSGAVYSAAFQENQVFWLSQDSAGAGWISRGENFTAQRISNYAIENQLQNKTNYPTLDDAVAYTIQYDGHLFYSISFPSAYGGAGRTWVYDNRNDQWHEESYTDVNGNRYRHRVQLGCAAYGKLWGVDHANANIYQIDPNNYTDNGMLIRKLLISPHQISLNNYNRVRYWRLIANMTPGSVTQGSSPAIPVFRITNDATNGTLLQDYVNPYDLNAKYTFFSGNINAEIVDDKIVGVATGNSNYIVGLDPPSKADYVITAPVYIEAVPSQPIPLNGAAAFFVGRADVSGNGYKAKISSNGTLFAVSLEVMNGGTTTTVSMGTPISSGYYQLTLTMKGTAISVKVQRSTDGYFLIPTGSWGSVPANAISISDTTYQAVGKVHEGLVSL